MTVSAMMPAVAASRNTAKTQPTLIPWINHRGRGEWIGHLHFFNFVKRGAREDLRTPTQEEDRSPSYAARSLLVRGRRWTWITACSCVRSFLPPSAFFGTARREEPAEPRSPSA